MTFNVGDIVQLKSGGPDMTVTRIGASAGEPMLWCTWFDGTKDAYGLFPPNALKAPLQLPEALKGISEPADALTETSEPVETLTVPTEPQAQSISEAQPTELDSAPVADEPAEAKQEAHPQQTDSAPVTPEPVEATQDPHSTHRENAIPAEENEKAQKATIASIQAILDTFFKRP
jgi:uncharacterized protein YodC (DUF2158 family)